MTTDDLHLRASETHTVGSDADGGPAEHGTQNRAGAPESTAQEASEAGVGGVETTGERDPFAAWESEDAPLLELERARSKPSSPPPRDRAIPLILPPSLIKRHQGGTSSPPIRLPPDPSSSTAETPGVVDSAVTSTGSDEVLRPSVTPMRIIALNRSAISGLASLQPPSPPACRTFEGGCASPCEQGGAEPSVSDPGAATPDPLSHPATDPAAPVAPLAADCSAIPAGGAMTCEPSDSYEELSNTEAAALLIEETPPDQAVGLSDRPNDNPPNETMAGPNPAGAGGLGESTPGILPPVVAAPLPPRARPPVPARTVETPAPETSLGSDRPAAAPEKTLGAAEDSGRPAAEWFVPRPSRPPERSGRGAPPAAVRLDQQGELVAGAADAQSPEAPVDWDSQPTEFDEDSGITTRPRPKPPRARKVLNSEDDSAEGSLLAPAGPAETTETAVGAVEPPVSLSPRPKPPRARKPLRLDEPGAEPVRGEPLQVATTRSEPPQVADTASMMASEPASASIRPRPKPPRARSFYSEPPDTEASPAPLSTAASPLPPKPSPSAPPLKAPPPAAAAFAAPASRAPAPVPIAQKPATSGAVASKAGPSTPPATQPSGAAPPSVGRVERRSPPPPSPTSVGALPVGPAADDTAQDLDGYGVRSARPRPPPPRRSVRRPVLPESTEPEPEDAGSPASRTEGSKRLRSPWWEEAFSEDFIRAERRLSPTEISREVDFIERSLGIQPGGVVLDLACGAGYHAVEMARRGYGVVGYDLSVYQLALAGDLAQERAQKINFMQGDVREMAFEETFDGVLCWNTSFGYFEEEKNTQVAVRIFQALRPGGTLLLDVTNRDFVSAHQPGQVSFRGDACVCMDDVSIDYITSRLRVKRSLILDDGRTRECSYSLRIYSLHELGKLLHDVGFRVCEVSGHPATQGAFFGTTSPRIIVLAQRP